MFPSGLSSLEKWDAKKLADVVFLNICALRILLAESESRDWAKDYCGKTDHDVRHWRVGSTDLFTSLHGLETANENIPVEMRTIRNWIGAAKRGHEDTETRYATSLFTRLDTMLKNRNPSMSAIRRLLLEWEELSLRERRLSVTRLLQFMRAKCPKSDLLPELEKAARRGRYELSNVCNPETGEGCGVATSDTERKPEKPRKKFGFLAGLAGAAAGYAVARRKTNEASDGATISANIATVPGALGTGFDPKGHKGIYEFDDDETEEKSKPTGRENAVMVLRREL